MNQARDILLDRMRGQLSQQDWCVQNVDLAGLCACPWFWNFCLTVGKRDCDFFGVLTAGGARAIQQLQSWNTSLFNIIREPFYYPEEAYIKKQMARFWEARRMTPRMEATFHPPSFDARTRVLTYVAILSDGHQRLLDKFGIYEHGTRMECLRSILQSGFRDSSDDDPTDRRLWGGRTQGSRRGVYMYEQKDDTWNIGNGYGIYTHMFGDGLFYAPCLYLAADYDKRITPTEHHQIVIPHSDVVVAKLRIRVTHYEGIEEGAAVVPVWIPEMEA